MNFVLVNGSTPYPQTFCRLCCELIAGNSYLREIGTQLPYCDERCYSLQCEFSALMRESRARAVS
ncbi:hypothetical protein [Bradyrhizobium neotropicale]|uniref:hypothetical protein n=1 Tax=Bradyrhizobium neotropicale TaxID=1497615 RepID=UPI001FF010AF|nr:hypothetical protein [Bradyrhizobium neotropicale]